MLEWIAWSLSMGVVLSGGPYFLGRLWFELGGWSDNYLERWVIRWGQAITICGVIWSLLWPVAAFAWLLVVIPL